MSTPHQINISELPVDPDEPTFQPIRKRSKKVLGATHHHRSETHPFRSTHLHKTVKWAMKGVPNGFTANSNH